ncbi:MAG: RNA polymerase sigma factor [Thermoanaerobaculia bacterium]
MKVPGDENASSVPIRTLVNSQDRFLSFLERRVKGREAARDILQRAYVIGLERQETLRDPERVVPWFYRVLRNAVIDHYRHEGAEKRALERLGAEQAVGNRLEPELERQICSCISDLIPELRPEYAQLIREVDLEEGEIAAIAERLRITPNNARVRLFRARRALRKALTESCGVLRGACLLGLLWYGALDGT